MSAEATFWVRVGIEAVACLIMLGGVIGILWERRQTNRGIGVRVIQLATVFLVLPTILILALEQILETQTTAALLGTIVGYVLSGIGKDESSAMKKQNRSKDTQAAGP